MHPVRMDIKVVLSRHPVYRGLPTNDRVSGFFSPSKASMHNMGSHEQRPLGDP